MCDVVISIVELSDIDLLYKLSKIINLDSDGDYFICKENKLIIEELYRRTDYLTKEN